jgi:hypothetical protein
MRRFPLRLRAALAKARIFPQRLSNHAKSPLLRLDADELLHRAADQPVSHDMVREILRDRKSIVWMGGAEPLAHPGIGHLTRLIAQAGNYLFLDTNGVALRGRIHEFQPLPRFYFSIRFLGCEAEHDRRSGRPGTFRAALEGIRTAQLSGFFVCANVVVSDGSDFGEALRLFDELRAFDLDGAVISSPSPDSAAAGVVAEARRRFLNSGWASFSRDVDAAAPLGSARHTQRLAASPSTDSVQDDLEESVQTR